MVQGSSLFQEDGMIAYGKRGVQPTWASTSSKGAPYEKNNGYSGKRFFLFILEKRRMVGP
jgi:hypothetical protein